MAVTRQIAGAEHSRADARGAGWRQAMLGMSTVLAPPSLVLLVLVVVFALTPIVCQTAGAWVLGAICGLGIGLCLLFLALASRQFRGYDTDETETDPSISRARFVAAMGRLSSLLSALVLLAMAIATFIISPCER
jgi:hypothetical protein